MPASPHLALGAVLLAGGASRRFGSDNKLLANIAGVPIVVKVAQEILSGGVSELVVVTGAEHARYVAALSGLPLRFVANPLWDDGIGTSIAAGVGALSRELHGAFVVPGDLPHLKADVFRVLARAFDGTLGEKVVVPVTAQGEQRNPVLWPRRLFPRLAVLSGPKGGKSLLDTLRDESVDVTFDDESVFADIDTPDDYARFITGA